MGIMPVACPKARKRFALAALAMSTLIVLAPGDQVMAQEAGQGQYLTEATQRLSKLIAQANQDGFIFDQNKFSIGGGWIDQNQAQWVALYTINLQAGKKYRFLAAGDNDARDVDLDVIDIAANKKVAEDVDAAPVATINFAPTVTQKYLVRVRLYNSDKNLPCLCLGVVMVQK